MKRAGLFPPIFSDFFFPTLPRPKKQIAPKGKGLFLFGVVFFCVLNRCRGGRLIGGGKNTTKKTKKKKKKKKNKKIKQTNLF